MGIFVRLAAIARTSAAWTAAFAFMLGVALAASPVAAQEEPATRPAAPGVVAVGLYVSPPFVMEEERRYTGMALDLWKELSADLGLRSDYRLYPTFRDLVRALERRDIDVAVTNLTITRERAQRIDFTQPWFDAGLRIMVNRRSGAGFRDVVAGLRSSGHLRAYAWLASLIVIGTLVLTLFDRRFDSEFPKRWRDGLAESFYSILSLVTKGQAPRKNPLGWIGRVFAALWLVFGLAVIAYVTSSVTSVMTTLSLTNQINSIADLSGRTVGVFTGSVAEQYARGAGLGTRSYADIDRAVAALRAGQIEAIVGDAPVLEYFVHSHPDIPVAVVGAIFEPDKYGFGLAHGHALTRPLTISLLGAHEADRVEALRTEYFGDQP